MFSWSQGLATRYDGGAPWRRQEPRSLDDIDALVQRMQQLKHSLGTERSQEIEAAPELFSDGEKFRIYHAEARWNAFWFTVASYVGGIGAANMFMPQLRAGYLANQYKPLVLAGCFVYFQVNY